MHITSYTTYTLFNNVKYEEKVPLLDLLGPLCYIQKFLLAD